MQRWQLTFRRGEELRYVGHLDLARAWERALRRAVIRLSYTQGFTPHPKMSFAAPLAVGVIGTAELLDVTLAEELTAEMLTARIAAQLPAGLALLAVAPLDGPPLPARLRFAEYRAKVATGLSRDAMTARLAALLAASALPRQRQREKAVRRYDLRPLIAALWLERWDEEQAIGMRLRADNAGAGRPDEVLAALDLAGAVRCIERTRLVLDSEAVRYL